MSIWIYPYRNGSNSVRSLSEALGAKVIKREGSRYRERVGKLVINWGASDCPHMLSLNNATAVRYASCKLSTLQGLYDDSVRVPEFTTSTEQVNDWLSDKQIVVARHILNGHSGNGIQLLDRADTGNIPVAPLYVLYVPKLSEFRVHVAGGEAIHIQKKLRSRTVADSQVNWKIRNSSTGFVFSSNPDTIGEIPDGVVEESVNAVASCGLNFGAVDVIVGKRDSLAYVLEVNTAPGIEGPTLNKYVEYFRGVHDNR